MRKFGLVKAANAFKKKPKGGAKGEEATKGSGSSKNRKATKAGSTSKKPQLPPPSFQSIQLCIRHLSNYGMEQGIYRVSGHQVFVEKLAKQIEEGSVTTAELQSEDTAPHNVASAIKKVLQSHEPLLSYQLQAGFSKVNAPEDEKLKELFEQLREDIRSLILALLSHLHTVAEDEETKMSKDSLSKTVGVWLLGKDNSQEEVAESQKVFNVLFDAYPEPLTTIRNQANNPEIPDKEEGAKQPKSAEQQASNGTQQERTISVTWKGLAEPTKDEVNDEMKKYGVIDKIAFAKKKKKALVMFNSADTVSRVLDEYPGQWHLESMVPRDKSKSMREKSRSKEEEAPPSKQAVGEEESSPAATPGPPVVEETSTIEERTLIVKWKGSPNPSENEIREQLEQYGQLSYVGLKKSKAVCVFEKGASVDKAMEEYPGKWQLAPKQIRDTPPPTLPGTIATATTEAKLDPSTSIKEAPEEQKMSAKQTPSSSPKADNGPVESANEEQAKPAKKTKGRFKFASSIIKSVARKRSGSISSNKGRKFSFSSNKERSDSISSFKDDDPVESPRISPKNEGAALDNKGTESMSPISPQPAMVESAESRLYVSHSGSFDADASSTMPNPPSNVVSAHSSPGPAMQSDEWPVSVGRQFRDNSQDSQIDVEDTDMVLMGTKTAFNLPQSLDFKPEDVQSPYEASPTNDLPTLSKSQASSVAPRTSNDLTSLTRSSEPSFQNSLQNSPMNNELITRDSMPELAYQAKQRQPSHEELALDRQDNLHQPLHHRSVSHQINEDLRTPPELSNTDEFLTFVKDAHGEPAKSTEASRSVRFSEKSLKGSSPAEDSANAEVSAKLTLMQARIDTLENLLASERQHSLALQSQHDEAHRSWVEEITKVRVGKLEAEEQAKDLRAKISSLESQVAAHDAEVSSLRRMFDNIEEVKERSRDKAAQDIASTTVLQEKVISALQKELDSSNGIRSLLQEEVKELQNKFNEAIKDLIQWKNRCHSLQLTMANHGLSSENDNVEVMHQLGRLMLETKIVKVMDQPQNKTLNTVEKNRPDEENAGKENRSNLENKGSDNSTSDTSRVQLKDNEVRKPAKLIQDPINNRSLPPKVEHKEKAIQAMVKHYVSNESQTIEVPDDEKPATKIQTSRDFFEKALKAQQDLATRLEKQLSNTRNELESLKLGAPKDFWPNQNEEGPAFSHFNMNSRQPFGQSSSYAPRSQGLQNWIHDRQQQMKLYRR